MKKQRLFNMISGIVLFLALIWFDRLTKNIAIHTLKNQPNIVMLNHVFELQYLENTGAAFGIFHGQIVPLLIITLIILAIIGHVYYHMPNKNRFRLLRFILVLIASGAIGNFIDRIANGYVVDFFYFSLINFPIFNVADIYVVVAAILLIWSVLFFYQEDELEELIKSLTLRKKKRMD